MNNLSDWLTLKFFLCIFAFIKFSLATVSDNEVNRPHIVFILADDLGWNDVGFHGSSEIPTPNIDALAYSGLILQNYYVTPICTPSRSALMTGKYPIHTGMQHTVLFGAEARGLPLSEKLLPEYLKELGYSTHIVGKWHLGHYKKEYTPLFRGFDSHLGYWTGHQDYFDHTAVENPNWGLDMRRNLDVAYDLHGQYTTHVISQESVKLIEEHNITKPMYLYIAHAAVHSANPYNPLPAPDKTVEKMSYIKDYNRRKFAAMLSELDNSVGEVIKALDKRNMLSNTIVIFSTDNGGPAEGFNSNAASNWPLRGVKNTLWEGGLRGVGLIWSPLIRSKSRIASQTMHITDWLPTLYASAGGNVEDLKAPIDGKNMWYELIEDEPSPRKDILHNIDDIYGSSALTIGDWKLVKGTNYNGQWDRWYGPAGIRTTTIEYINNILKSPSGLALTRMKAVPTVARIKELRNNANIICSYDTNNSPNINPCKPLQSPCLFNIKEDPCEQNNLSERFPQILKTLLIALEKYNATAIPPSNLPSDPRADPKYWNYTWTNFGDFVE